MERDGTGRSLHEMLAAAVERAAHAQEESLTLIAHQDSVRADVRETLASIARRRATFGNRQRGVRGRSHRG